MRAFLSASPNPLQSLSSAISDQQVEFFIFTVGQKCVRRWLNHAQFAPLN